MNEQIKAGDNVRLKAGGPTMTVDDVKEINGVVRAYCSWFIKDEHKHSSFPVTSLDRLG